MPMMSRDDVFALLERGTGTEDGIHRDIHLVECARKVKLDDQNKQFSFSFKRDVGTMVHALLRCWHEGELIRIPRPNWGIIDDLHAILEEAWRVFDDYVQRIPPHGWGHVIAAELPLDGVLPNGIRKTGQLDLLIDWCGCASVCKPMAERTLLPMVPGAYVVDHKITGQKDSKIAERYNINVQPTLYQFLLKQQRPDLNLQGMIINNVVRHQKMTAASYCSVLVDPPSDEKIRRLCEFVAFAKELENRDAINLNNCIDKWNNICPHLYSGACQ